MAESITNYTGDGVTDIFEVGFNWLNNDLSIVTVFLDGVQVVEGVDWDFEDVLLANVLGINLSASTLKFTTAPADQADIVFKRITDTTEIDSLFSNTSILINADLDRVNLQLLYKAQEIFDQNNEFINTFSGNNQMNQNLDMNSYNIINLADAVNPNDALNLGQAEQLVADFEEPMVEYIVNGIGYEVAQTALSGYDLELETEGGVEFASRELTAQYLISSYPEFDSATNGAYGIGGGLFELPFIESPDINQQYYIRLK